MAAKKPIADPIPRAPESPMAPGYRRAAAQRRQQHDEGEVEHAEQRHQHRAGRVLRSAAARRTNGRSVVRLCMQRCGTAAAGEHGDDDLAGRTSRLLPAANTTAGGMRRG
jgi:hypothetical protein